LLADHGCPRAADGHEVQAVLAERHDIEPRVLPDAERHPHLDSSPGGRRRPRWHPRATLTRREPQKCAPDHRIRNRLTGARRVIEVEYELVAWHPVCSVR